jgi:hypothetical protein
LDIGDTLLTDCEMDARAADSLEPTRLDMDLIFTRLQNRFMPVSACVRYEIMGCAGFDVTYLDRGAGDCGARWVRDCALQIRPNGLWENRRRSGEQGDQQR